MKFTFLSLMLLVSTASFGNTVYIYDGVSPLKKSPGTIDNKCSVALEMVTDNTMGSLKIYSQTMETGGWDTKTLHYPQTRTIDFINDKNNMFELEYPTASEGLDQTSSGHGEMTYKIKGTETKVEIKMKGTEVSEIKSLVLKKKYDHFLGKTYTSECIKLVLRSATLN